MPSYRTHLTILQQTAALHPDADAFRVPHKALGSDAVSHWETVSYRKFFEDVERFARYWTVLFASHSIPLRSVIGLWLGGVSYTDAVHIYSIVRAGYIPQLFSLRLPSPEIVYEMLDRAGGRALIYDTEYASMVAGPSTVPAFPALDARELFVPAVSLPPNEEGTDPEGTLMIFHTSGSTSGRPKLVPVSYRWWDFTMSKTFAALGPKPRRQGRQDVAVWMGSLCHFGQSFMLSGMIQHASCTIVYTKQNYSSDELADMVARCGLSRMHIFPPYLTHHLRASRRDPELLGLLQGLDEILVSGTMMSSEDEEWVLSQGIRLRNCYGSTEVGSMLMSADPSSGSHNLRVLAQLPGTSYSFVPIDTPEDAEAESDDSGYDNAHAQLLALVISAASPDCPDRSLRHADGDFHTGDLFSEVAPGRYVFRGRNDDWIKTENCLRCDTKAVEDNVLETCADLVAACIVVGNGRPSPALFVEAKDAAADPARLKRDVLRRIRPFHARRYMHERVVSADLIFVVPPATLPRTASKGNIRRRAVEEAFKAKLDAAYAATA